MKRLKRLLFPAILCLLLLCGCASGASGDTGTSQPVPTVKTDSAGKVSLSIGSGEDYRGRPTQNVAKRIAAPERIRYLNDGVQTVFDKDSEPYTQIVALVKKEIKHQGERVLPRTKGMIGEEYSSEGMYLIYEYADDSYAPIFFELESGQLTSPNSDSGKTYAFAFYSDRAPYSYAFMLVDYLNTL